MVAEIVSILAVSAACLSAFYTGKVVKESKKSNELNRFKALLELKSSYIEEMQKQVSLAREWGSDDGFTKACRDSYADAQKKYREVIEELDSFHTKLVEKEYKEEP